MELLAFLEKQQHILLLAMGILFFWAVGNMLFSTISLLGKPTPPEKRMAFHQMNLAWAFINSIIVVWGITHPLFEGLSPTTSSLLNELQWLKDIFLLNAGLDILYMLVGFYLHRRKSGRKPLRANGFGQAIILQGGFLFIFDSMLWMVFHQQELALFEWMP